MIACEGAPPLIALTKRETVCESFRGLQTGVPEMTRITREALERKLEQARRLALEPTDPLTRERLAQMVEELEFQLQDQRKVA
jgi:hypothetical protein